MLKINGISKTFVIKKKTYRILEKIHLDINTGDIFGLIGKTGSGKTTLLRIMNGFLKADNEENIIRKFTRMESSMIFQHFNLLHNLNVFDNAALPLKLRKITNKDIDHKINNLLQMFGLLEIKNAYPKILSGGQKQRLAIVRSLSILPKIIFCDEPTSALDEETSQDILKIIKEINQRYKTTIVFVSHDMKIIQNLCNKIAILEKGLIIKQMHI
ncbi:MAG: ATP-binding cassette domain-containing protein [Vigna little leaf phytoplasma]|nr:ATP-binding cassette domain-containing protein [Vigna little leaf phytoplasma]